MKTLYACLLVSLAPLASADVLDVGGPAPDAATIQGAVDLAVDGDVIRVYPGSYAGFAIDGKSLSVIPSADGVFPDVNGQVLISNLLVGQAAELSNLRVTASNPLRALEVNACTGSVRITDCTFEVLASTSFSNPATGRIAQSDDVVVRNCSFVGVMGRSADPNQGGDGYDAGDALQVSTSQVAFLRSTATGGMGGDGFFVGFVSGFGGDGGDAIDVSGACDLFVSTSVLAHGEGGWDDFIINFGRGLRGRDLRASGPCSVQDKNSLLTLTSLTGGATRTTLAGVQPRLSTPASRTDQEPLPVTITGQPGDRVGLFFGTAYDHQVLIGSGPLLVHIPQSFDRPNWRFLGTLDASGSLTVDVPMRDLPMLTHVKLHLVGVTLGSAGRHFTNSASPLILDSAW